MSPVYWPLFCELTFSWGPCSRTIKKRICGHNTALQWVQIALAIKQKGPIHKRNSLGSFAYSKRGKKKKKPRGTLHCACVHLCPHTCDGIFILQGLHDFQFRGLKCTENKPNLRGYQGLGTEMWSTCFGLKKETHRKIRLCERVVFLSFDLWPKYTECL